MRRKTSSSKIAVLIIAGTCVTVVFLIAILSLLTPPALSKQSYTGTSIVPGAQTIITIVQTPEPLATTKVTPDIKVSTPTVGIGDFFQVSSLQNSPGLRLRRTGVAPHISYLEAMEAVYNNGIGWGLGGNINGKEVSVLATYALATFGEPGPSGKWQGPENINLYACKSQDHCTLVTTLPRIEDRPMWVIDYGNLEIYGLGAPPSSYPNYPTPAPLNHAVYAVDAETGAIPLIWAYQG